MIYNDVELFNAEQAVKNEDIGGAVLNRFSRHAISGLDTGEDRRGPVTQAYGNDIEIRFVSESDSVDVFLGAWDNDGYVSVSLGDFDHSTVYLPQNQISCITLEKHPRLKLLDTPGPERFSKDLWRIKYLKRFTPVFSHVDGKSGAVRPPECDEVPKKTMLAYGSSITFGAGTGPMSALTHMEIVARKLNIDVINKSMPGSCFCELSYGDYLSGIPADYYYYELGGNMRLRFTPGEFEKRAVHMVTETRRKNPSAPIILLTVYPLLNNIPDENHTKAASTIKEFNETLIKLAQNDDKIYLVDSAKILKDTRLLSYDGLHPSGFGNIVMAENIYMEIKHVLTGI